MSENTYRRNRIAALSRAAAAVKIPSSRTTIRRACASEVLEARRMLSALQLVADSTFSVTPNDSIDDYANIMSADAYSPSAHIGASVNIWNGASIVSHTVSGTDTVAGLYFPNGTYDLSQPIVSNHSASFKYEGQSTAAVFNTPALASAIEIPGGGGSWTGGATLEVTKLGFNGPGIHILNALPGPLKIHDNLFTGVYSGTDHPNAIEITQTLTDCDITTNQFFDLTGTVDNAIIFTVAPPANTNIDDNEFANIGTGIKVAFSDASDGTGAHVTANRNHFVGVRKMAMELQGNSCPYLQVEDNKISGFANYGSDNLYGLSIPVLNGPAQFDASKKVTISGNEISGLASVHLGRYAGLLAGIEGGGYNTLIDDNAIYGAGVAVAITNGGNITISNNKFRVWWDSAADSTYGVTTNQNPADITYTTNDTARDMDDSQHAVVAYDVILAGGSTVDNITVSSSGVARITGGVTADSANFASGSPNGTPGWAFVYGYGNDDVLIQDNSSNQHTVVFDGGDGNDSLVGGPQGDWLIGGSGADTLDGGAGDDFVGGGVGSDSLIGGSGSGDWLEYSDKSQAQPVTVALTSGTAGQSGTEDSIAGFENVIGGEGNDTITGDSGNNVIEGDPGDYDGSTLGGTGGSDSLSGGSSGVDTLSYASQIGHPGESVVFDIPNGHTSDTHQGALHAGVTDTFSNFDLYVGGKGDDRFIGLTPTTPGTGVDSLFGGSGNDTIDYSSRTSGLTVNLESGSTAEDILDSFENVWGGSGNDSIVGSDGDNNTLKGNAGNDTIDGGGGNDSIEGGNNDDSVIGDLGADDLQGGSGTDRIDYSGRANAVRIAFDVSGGDGDISNSENDYVHGDFEILVGGAGSDVIVGDSDNETIIGNNGGDTIQSLAGNDSIDGGSGNDSIRGGDDNDTILGSSGNDTIKGDDGADYITPGADADTVSGDNDNDTVYGGSAADGADDLSGNAGNDTIDYSGRSIGVRIAPDALADDGETGESDLVRTDFETLIGGSGNDGMVGTSANERLIGNDGDDNLQAQGGADRVEGGDGADTLRGGTGNDSLYGGIGNDSLVGDDNNDYLVGEAGTDTVNGSNNDDVVYMGTASDGADDLAGGSGTDTIDYHDRTNGVRIAPDAVTDDGETSEGDLVRTDFEVLEGGSGNDGMVGTSANETLRGHDGNDNLQAQAGADSIDGGTGNDTLRGGDGNDSITGGTGTDSIFGDNDIDSFFVQDSASDTVNGGAGVDTVVNSDGIDVLTNI